MAACGCYEFLQGTPCLADDLHRFSRRTGNDCTSWDIVKYRRADADEASIANRDPLDAAAIRTEPCSLSDDHSGADLRASSYDRVWPSPCVVTYMAEVVDLRPAEHACHSKANPRRRINTS
jgi:hypothetical protein